jgi:hypothetical protein
MKTLKQVEKEYTKVFSDFDMKSTVRNRKLEIMKQCKLYLQTNPNEDFVKKMKDEQDAKLDKINAGFLPWLFNTHGIEDISTKSKKLISKYRSEYNSLLNKTKVKFQIKALTYLLSE